MSDLMYTRIIQAAIETPWAILPAKLAIIRDLLAYRAGGGKLTPDEVRERIGSGEPRGSSTISAANGNGSQAAGGAVAVLPLVGTLIPRGDSFSEMSGAMSVQRFTRSFRQAMADPEVGSVVLDVDSPGGSVDGIPELASEIFQARGRKPITAVANHLAASAAYWIAAAADELVVSPSAEVGSIGVFAMHQDISGWLENEGIKVNLISAGKFKVEGNPFEELGEEARAAIQTRIDDYYRMFTGDVAKFRGVKRSEVVNGFGEGRVVTAKTAVSLGMADRIGTLDEEIGRLARSSRRRTNASVDFRRRRLRAVLGAASVEAADDAP